MAANTLVIDALALNIGFGAVGFVKGRTLPVTVLALNVAFGAVALPKTLTVSIDELALNIGFGAIRMDAGADDSTATSRRAHGSRTTSGSRNL